MGTALKYGFVSAGGGAKYWKPLRLLDEGMRVFAYVGGAGYVGVGAVTGLLMPLAELEVDIDGQRRRLIDLPDCPPPERDRALLDDADMTEYAVPVQWLAKRTVEQAFKEPGLRAQQLPCRLYHEPTIRRVEEALGLDGTTG